MTDPNIGYTPYDGAIAHTIFTTDPTTGALTIDLMKITTELVCVGGNVNAMASQVGTPSNPASVPAIMSYSTIQTTDLMIANGNVMNLYSDSSGTHIYNNLTVDGTVSTPTPPANNNSTRVVTTAYVQNSVATISLTTGSAGRTGPTGPTGPTGST